MPVCEFPTGTTNKANMSVYQCLWKIVKKPLGGWIKVNILERAINATKVSLNHRNHPLTIILLHIGEIRGPRKLRPLYQLYGTMWDPDLV